MHVNLLLTVLHGLINSNFSVPEVVGILLVGMELQWITHITAMALAAQAFDLGVLSFQDLRRFLTSLVTKKAYLTS